MNRDEAYSKILDCSIPTYYNHKKQNRPIINLIDRYFTTNDLEEFLRTGRVEKFEEIQFSNNLICEKYEEYIIPIIKECNINNFYLEEYINRDKINLQNDIFRIFPIFIYFEFIFHNEEYEMDSEFASDIYRDFDQMILNILEKYKSSAMKQLPFRDLLIIDTTKIEILEIFIKNRNFNIYYDNKVINTNQHKRYEELYHSIKKIINTDINMEKKNLMIKNLLILFKI